MLTSNLADDLSIAEFLASIKIYIEKKFYRKLT